MNYSYSDKDFFGDPRWPIQKQFAHEERRRQSKNKFQFDNSNSQQIYQNGNINHNNHLLNDYFYNENEQMELDNSFILNQQRMLNSNFKHSQLTYLGDQIDKSNNQVLMGSRQSSSQYENQLKQQYRQFQGQNYFVFDTQQKQLEQNQSASINSFQKQQEFQQAQDNLFIANRVKTSRNKKIQMENSKQYKKTKKIQIRKRRGKKIIIYQSQIVKSEPQIKNQSFVKLQQHDSQQNSSNHYYQNFNFQNKIQYFSLHEKDIQNSILQKLYVIDNGQDDSPLIKKTSKVNKYKILTKQEKQFIVYLSSKHTTCSIGRRFNISVNNICRWKKSCERKSGAGRKIINLQLQKKSIIQGSLLTRKVIQNKARQFSQNQNNFKASKGWFQRFYHRNLFIFKVPEVKKSL